jgi:chemotaxis family two-component system response regulator Rcp1
MSVASPTEPAVEDELNILLVEDNPADIRLMLEIFREGEMANDFHVVTDGVEALRFLRKDGEYSSKPRPDLVFLDLNLPRKHGREVLREMKADEDLRRIPVIVMTSSEAEEDIADVYQNSASCYITKPVDLEEFMSLAAVLKKFGLSVVKLPKE